MSTDEKYQTLILRIGLGLTGVLCWRQATALWDQSVAAMVPLALGLMLAGYLFGFALLALAALPAPPRWSAHASLGGLLLVGCSILQIHVVHQSEAGFPLTTDALIYMDYGARLLLEGHNPYAHDLSEAYRLNQLPMFFVTSLVDGDITGRFAYPALSTLVFVPCLAIGLPTHWLYPACLVASLALLYRLCPRPYRPVVLLPFFIEPSFFSYVLGGVTDGVWALLLVLMLKDWRHPKRAAVWLGLACAYKHPPWVIAAYLLVRLWQQSPGTAAHKRREVAIFAGIATATFLVVNLPFIIWDPTAWFLGVSEPVRAEMVSFGQGLSALTMTGLAVVPKDLYSLFRLVLWLATLGVYFRHARRLPALMWLMPAFVLWFGHRSLTSYWYFNLIPLVFDLVTSTGKGLTSGTTGSRRWIGDVAVVGGLATLMLATPGIFALRSAPVRMELAGPVLTRGTSAHELTVEVENRSERSFEPRFTVQSVGSQPFYWTIASPAQALLPGTRARYRIERSAPFAGFDLKRGARLTVIDGRDGDRRSTVVVPGDPSYLQPDLIPNGDFRYWEGRAPTFWGFIDEGGTGARLHYEALSPAAGPSSAVRMVLPKADVERRAALDTYLLLPDRKLAVWVKRPAGANGDLTDLSLVYALRVVAAAQELWILFGAERANGQLDEGVSYQMVPSPEGEWTKHELHLPTLMQEVGIDLLAYRTRLPRFEHLDFPMTPVNLQYFVRAAPELASLSVQWGPIHAVDDDHARQRRFRRGLARPYELDFWRGEYNLAARNYAKAAVHFRRGLALAPEAGPAHFGLARALFGARHWSAALPHYQRAAELGAEPALAHKGSAWCHYRLGQHEQALSAWQLALPLMGSRAAARAHRAEALMGMALALVALERCSEAAIKYTEAQAEQLDNRWPQDWFARCQGRVSTE